MIPALLEAGGWERLTVIDRPGTNFDALAELGGTVVLLPTAGPLAWLLEQLRECAWPGRVRCLSQRGAELDHNNTREDWLLLLGESRWPDCLQMLPLHGCRVVVTREAKQGEAWVRELTELGAEVIAFPTLRLEPPTDPGPLDRALNRLEEFDWLVFTSVNGVQYFLAALDRAGLDLRLLGTCQLAAIGPSTAAALARAHLRADLVPPQFVAESLVEAFADHPMEGRKILIPRAEQARDLLPEALRSRGAQVEVTPAYRTVVPERSQIDLESANWVTFASSSSVRHFVELVGSHRALPVLAIGPITADSARAAGFKRVEMAEVYTLAGMTQRLIELAK